MNSSILRIDCYHHSPLLMLGREFESTDALQRIHDGLDLRESAVPELPFPYVTATMCTLLVVSYGLTHASLSGIGAANPLYFGAWYPRFLHTGDIFRLVSYAFLHRNLVHLVQNVAILAAAGLAVEHVWGRWRFMSVFFIGCVAGALGGFYYKFAVIMGASAGVAALVASYVYLRVLKRGKFQERFPAMSNLVLLAAIGTDFGISIFQLHIAIVSHVAGFAAGFFYAWTLDKVQNYKSSTIADQIISIAAIALLLQSIYVSLTWSESRTLGVVRSLLQVSSSEMAANDAGWMLATIHNADPGLIHESINELRKLSRHPESRDTLALLYARSGDFERAESIENSIVQRLPGAEYATQLARFERKKHVFDVMHSLSDGKLEVAVPSSIDIVCQHRVFRRFDVEQTANLRSRCAGEYELIAVRQGRARQFETKLDPRVLALPL